MACMLPKRPIVRCSGALRGARCVVPRAVPSASVRGSSLHESASPRRFIYEAESRPLFRSHQFKVPQYKIQYNKKYNIIRIIHNTGGSPNVFSGLSSYCSSRLQTVPRRRRRFALHLLRSNPAVSLQPQRVVPHRCRGHGALRPRPTGAAHGIASGSGSMMSWSARRL